MKQVRDPAALREAIASRGLSHRQLAKLAGCTHGMVGHLLRGRRTVNDTLARRIAEALARPLASLFVAAPSSDEQRITQRKAVA